jgi:hypothetical protein
MVVELVYSVVCLLIAKGAPWVFVARRGRIPGGNPAC